MSEAFDFEAFISGAQLARRTVHAFKVDNREEIRTLAVEYEQAARDAGDRESSKSVHAALADRIDALRKEMEASRIEFVIRSVSFDEALTIAKPETNLYDQLAIQSVQPQLTADQWRRVADVIGAAQFTDIVNAANDIIRSKVAVPDFSPPGSTTQSPPASSQS